MFVCNRRDREKVRKIACERVGTKNIANNNNNNIN